MKLKDFVKGTLEEIVGALVEFEESEQNHGATAFTEIYTKGESAAHAGILKAPPRGENANNPTVLAINYDVAVTVEEEGIKMAGGGLSIPGIGGAKGEGSQTDKNTTANRISFSVPLELPVTQERKRKKPKSTTRRRTQRVSDPNAWMAR